MKWDHELCKNGKRIKGGGRILLSGSPAGLKNYNDLRLLHRKKGIILTKFLPIHGAFKRE